MRVRCPACAAPYFLPDGPPPEGARCPNCEAPAPTSTRPPSEPEPEAVGYSRAVGLVAVLHLIVAAGGLCCSVGISSAMGDLGIDWGGVFTVLFGLAWATVWGGTGIGILRRWEGAWVISLSIVSGSLLLIAFGARGNPLGAICNGLLCAGILCVLIARKGEFR